MSGGVELGDHADAAVASVLHYLRREVVPVCGVCVHMCMHLGYMSTSKTTNDTFSYSFSQRSHWHVQVETQALEFGAYLLDVVGGVDVVRRVSALRGHFRESRGLVREADGVDDMPVQHLDWLVRGSGVLIGWRVSFVTATQPTLNLV